MEFIIFMFLPPLPLTLFLSPTFCPQVATFLEANGRGYWEASDEVIDRLRQLYTDVEDKIEGVE